MELFAQHDGLKIFPTRIVLSIYKTNGNLEKNCISPIIPKTKYFKGKIYASLPYVSSLKEFKH